MVRVKEANDIIFSHLYKPRIVPVALTDAGQNVLAEKILADRDFPPFNRVAMDGIAIDYSEFKKGTREFPVEQIQAAGEPQKKVSTPANCLEVMTGAVLPEHTDTVIRYEDIQLTGGKAQIQTEDVSQGQNVHSRGQDAAKDDVLLLPGMVLSPAEIALLASVGKNTVSVFSFPTAAVVASGDELVEVAAVPESHQIRRSNTYALQAAMRDMGWNSTQYHLADSKELLLSGLKKIVQENDVVILSGGVSKGKFDFIPEVLEELGIKNFFYQVMQRPGKPFWFGASNDGKVVFALPGNPVSTYMCYYRYVKPWVLKSLSVIAPPSYAVLAKDFVFQPKLTYFLQVKIQNENGKLMAYPDTGGGSGDFANLKDVDGFLELPLEQSEFKAGEVFPYIPFRK